MKEIFKDFEGYKVSNLGNCINAKIVDNQGYYKISSTNLYVHILIAKAFPEICGKWFDGCHVHHKDFNKHNNNADNLIILSPSEHIRIHHIGLKQSEDTKKRRSESMKGKMINHKAISKKVLCIELNKIYKSSMDAERKTNICRGNICMCCRGEREKAGGYHWKYVK